MHDDGGPAFPFSARFDAGSFDPILQEQLPAGHARQHVFSGMTLRDYAALKALQGILAALPAHITVRTEDARRALAEDCYAIADAMLAARKEPGT